MDGVSEAVIESGPDGATTVLPRLDWMRLWIDRVKAQELPQDVLGVAADLLGWEAEHTAWKREGEPVTPVWLRVQGSRKPKKVP